MTSESKDTRAEQHVQNIPLDSLADFKKWCALFRVLNAEVKLSFNVIYSEKVEKKYNDTVTTFHIVEHCEDSCWWLFKMGDLFASCFLSGASRHSRQSISIARDFKQESSDFFVKIPKSLSATPTIRMLPVTEEQLYTVFLFFFEHRDFSASAKIELDTTVVLKEIDIVETEDV